MRLALSFLLTYRRYESPRMKVFQFPHSLAHRGTQELPTSHQFFETLFENCLQTWERLVTAKKRFKSRKEHGCGEGEVFLVIFFSFFLCAGQMKRFFGKENGFLLHSLV